MSPTAVRPRQPRTRANGDSRRKLIIKMATEIISTAGFHKARLADIAAAAGCTQAGLLHHFPSKEHLLLAVLAQRDALTEAQVRDAKHDGILSFLAILEQHESNLELMRLMTFLSTECLASDHAGHEFFEQRYDNLVVDMVRRVAAVVDVERLPHGVGVEEIARLLIGASDGLRIQMLYHPGSFRRADVMRTLYALIQPYVKQ